MIDPAVSWIAAIAASLIFAASAIMKLRNLELFESAVINYRILPRFLAALFARLIPIAELGGALALLWPAWRTAGAAIILFLLVIFTLGIAINLMRGRHDVDCGCFGPALRQTLSWWLVLRNLALAALAAILLLKPNGRTLMMLDDFTIICGVITILLIYASINYVFANLPRLREIGARYA
jgi:hypothetical protein